MRSSIALCLALALTAGPASAHILRVNGVDYCFPQPIQLGLNGTENALIRAANVGWVRITIPWRDVNPSPGVWGFGGVDALVNDARARGLKILAILSTAPQWACNCTYGNVPPSNIALWEEYVRRTAQQYRGKIAAYEIWNEPDIRNNDLKIHGVGWLVPFGQSPLYVDYLRAAALQIRAHAPGTLVVGPVSRSKPEAETVQLFQEIEQTTFPEGPASQFIDVVSFHAGAIHTDSSGTVNDWINSHLGTLSNRNPSNARKPIWITEFGWKSNSVGEASQRDRINTIVGWLTASDAGLWFPLSCSGKQAYKLTHAFIYKAKDTPDESRGVYRGDNSPKPTVTGYLQPKPFPARHLNAGHAPVTYSCVGRTCTFTNNAPASGEEFESYLWDFGDGTPVGGGTGSAFRTVSHTFPAAGQYFVASAATFVFIDGTDIQLVQVP